MYRSSLHNDYTMKDLLEISTESYAQGPISHQMASTTLTGALVYYYHYPLTYCYSVQCQNLLLHMYCYSLSSFSFLT